MSRGGTPPVQSNVQRQETGDKASRTLMVIQEKLRENNAAEAKAIRAMLGGNKALMERFISTTSRLLLQNSNILRTATPESILDSIMQAASLGLEPLTDDGAIVVYGSTARFQPMYRGYLKRIRNSGQVQDIDTQVVYENDEFEHQQGTDPWIKHVPFRVQKDTEGNVTQDRGGYRGAYAWALMPSGKYIIEWMDEAEINYVRDTFSQASRNDSPWRTSWGEMARKTVLRRLAKRLPASAVNMLLEADSEADNAERTMQQLNAPVDQARLAAVEAAVGLIPGATAVPTEPVTVQGEATEVQPEAEAKEEPAGVGGGLFSDAG